MSQSDTDAPDEGDLERLISDRLSGAIEQLRSRGIDDDEISGRISRAVSETASESGRRVADDLLRQAPDFLTYERTDHWGFMERVRLHYGPAFDAYYATMYSAREIAEKIASENHGPDEPALLHVLLNLQGRACLTAWEVYALLFQGFPSGALARARTLHEIAVVAAFIAQHSRDEGHDDLPVRFVDHAAVQTWGDAKAYQRSCEALGYEPLDAETFGEISDRYRKVMSEYEPDFDQPYGWAAKAAGKARPNFADLESAVDRGEMRGHYKWACHFVHADAKGMLLNFVDFRGSMLRVTGPTNLGFVEPANMALTSLVEVTTTLLWDRDQNSHTIDDLLAMTTIMAMHVSTIERFGEGEQRVDEAEQRILAEHQRTDGDHS